MLTESLASCCDQSEPWAKSCSYGLRLWLVLLFLLVFWTSGVFAATPVSIVDVMVIYTSKARAGAGGTAAMQSQIQMAMMEANTVFENSGAYVRVRLVHSGEVSYGESASVATDLARLRLPTDGYMDEVHVLRNQYGADLVSLVTETGEDYWFYGLQGPSSANAFSIIRRPYLVGSYYFPVVLGFNFGCQIERLYADSTGAFPYSYGYSFYHEVYGWTISTVEGIEGQRLPYFSNPEITLLGEPLGVPDGKPGAANNSKTINNTAPLLAAFRGSAPTTFPPVIQITSPSGSSSNPINLNAGVDLPIVVDVSDQDGSVTRVDFFAVNGNDFSTSFLGTAEHFPYSFTWTNLLPGNFTLYAQATDSTGGTSLSTTPVCLEIHSVTPANDNFAARRVVSGTNVHIAGWNTLATSEDNEPNHVGVSGGHSVWWSWTAPWTGKVRLTTAGSDFNTVLAVYEGSNLSDLTLVAGSYYYNVSELLFEAAADKTYAIVVDGYYDANGNVFLSLEYPPVPTNDDFARRIPLDSTSLDLDASNIYAGYEPGEPSYPWTTGEGSVWWQWTAPAKGSLEISASGSPEMQRILSVYSGSSISNLQVLAAAAERWVPTRVFVDVEPGQTISISADTTDRGGLFTLSLLFRRSPSNDDFENGLLLTGSHLLITNSNLGATAQTGEPEHSGQANANSLWWRWEAPAAGVLKISSLSDHAIVVFTGDVLTDLQQVDAGGDLLFPVTQGQTYHILVDGYAGDVIFELLFSGLHFTSPTPGAKYLPGAEILVTVESSISETNIQSLEIFRNGVSLAVFSQPPYSLHWPNAVGGAYTLNGIATDTEGRQISLASRSLNVVPANDDFAQRIPLTGVSLVVTQSNLGATFEEGEPQQSYLSVGDSTWWSWTAPANGRLRLDFRESQYSPVVTLYAGDNLTNLALIGRAYTSFSTDPIAVFDVEAGINYKLAMVSFWGPVPGRNIKMALTFEPFPVNDGFSNRFALSGLLATGRSANTLATSESGEASSYGHTVWWSWTAVQSGPVNLSSSGSSFAPWLAVYTGSVLPTLNRIVTGSSQVSFQAIAGTTYQISADANPSYQTGSIQLNLVSGFPPNDSFSNRAALTGSNFSFYASNAGATREPAEPLHGGYPGSNSVWWTWTAPGPGSLHFSVAGDGFAPVWSIYKGTALSDLTKVENGSNGSSGKQGSTTVPVSPGDTLQLVVDGDARDQKGPVGIFRLELNYIPLPGNDNFAARFDLSGSEAHVTANSSGATHEPGEPSHAGYAGGHSLWWAWTAPTNGRVTLDASGSQVTTLAAVYTGADLTNLVEVISGAVSVAPIQFDCTAGTDYKIALDHASAGIFGAVKLNLLLSTLRLLEPQNEETFVAPAPISLKAETTEWDGDFKQVEFLADGLVVGTTAQAPYSFLWEYPPLGNHLLQARVFDSNGTMRVTAPKLVHVRPENDYFTNATAIGSAYTLVSEVGFNASLEPGEPTHGEVSGASLWWKWTPSFSGLAAIQKPGSSDYRYQVFYVYTGTSVTNLHAVTNTQFNGSGTIQSLINFDAYRGTDYYIAVSGPATSLSNVLFEVFLTPGPANDDFANRLLIAGSNVLFSGSNIGSTHEPGEPAGSGSGQKSVWWTWTAPDTSLVHLSIEASGWSPALGVYTGDNVSSLARIASAVGPSLTFQANAGITYQIGVDSSDGGAQNDFPIHLECVTRPLNNSFATRTLITGAELSVDETASFADVEPGEPLILGRLLTHSVWFTWVAPFSGHATVSVNSQFSPAIGIFSGSTLESLNPIAVGITNFLQFDALSGSAYQLVVDSDSEDTGDFTLAIKLVNVELTSPVEQSSFVAPTNVELTAWTADVGGQTQWVEFNDGANLLARITVLPFTLTWTNPPVGLHVLTARALDASGSLSTSAPVRIVVVGRNDPFAEAEWLGATNSLLVGDTSLATSELNEPLGGGGTGKTLWWKWTAPANGTLNLFRTNVFATGHSGFPPLPPAPPLPGKNVIIIINPPGGNPPPGSASGPLVTIFTGTTFDSLTAVTSNNVYYSGSRPYPSGWRSLDTLSLPVTQGLAYQIQVDGFNGISGLFELGLQFITDPPPPSNDNFADRATVTDSHVPIIGRNVLATREPDEPLLSEQASGASVWWSWAAPSEGIATIAVSAGLPTIVGVFTGDTIDQLTSVAQGLSRARFYAEAGKIYQICIDGVNGAKTNFTWTLDLTIGPSNDNFSGRLPLDDGQVWGTTASASREPDEPWEPDAPDWGTVWYSWTAPTSGDVSINVSSYNGGASGLAVYVGSSLSNLLLVARSFAFEGSQVTFYAVKGTTYQIAVSDYDWSAGDFILDLRAILPAPYFQTPPLASGDGFHLVLHGTNGQSFVIQASTNLLDWTNFRIDTFLGDTYDFIDSEVKALPRRFFRVLPLEAAFSHKDLQVDVGLPLVSSNFRVHILGPGGQPFVLQSSTNLLDWGEITRGVIYGERFDYSEPIAPSEEKKFYRAVPLK